MPENPYEAPKGKRLTIALAVFALIVIPLAIYVAGYLLLPFNHYWSDQGEVYWGSFPSGTQDKLVTIEHQYPQQWMTTFFRPAAQFEGWLRGVEVYAVWSNAETSGEIEPGWVLPEVRP